MKISVVITVLNEAETIGPLLDSLLSQTKKPDEILVVDGKSKDRTPEIVAEYQKRHGSIRLLVEKGSIGHGRNFAVKNAKHDLIAQTDGGCIVDENWLERLIQPLLHDPEVGLSAGFYKMTGETAFQKAIFPYFGVPVRRYDPRSFLPSSRSVAFRKEVWGRVGGYSEGLDRAGEDTLFNYNVLKASVKIARVKDAIVYWEVPKTFLGALKKLYGYAKGDAQANIWWHPAQGLATHNIKIVSIYLRYSLLAFLFIASPTFPFFFFILIVAFISYTSWTIWKTRDVVHDFYSKLWVPAVQIISDFTIMLGFAEGLSLRLRHPKRFRATHGPL